MSDIDNKIKDIHTKMEVAIKACVEVIGATRRLELTIDDEGKDLRAASDLWLLRSKVDEALVALRSERYRPWNLRQDITEVKA